MKKLISLLCLLLTSCVNPYMQFYQGVSDARLRPDYEPVLGELKIYSTDNIERDGMELMRRGYTPVGQSSFNAAANQVSEHQLREQAQKIGAHIVLISSKYTHTVSGAVPLVIPQTTTSYSSGTATAYGSGGIVNAYGSGTTTTYGSQTMMMPYSVARADFGALYFVKSKARLGIFPRALDDETRKRLETNSGIKVLVVSEGSTAFLANVLPGDVLLKVGGESVQSMEHYYKLLDKYEGQTVSFQLDRDGKKVEKRIEILSYKQQSTPR